MMVEKTFTEDMLDGLKEQLSSAMSEKRYTHTCAVERMAVRLGELFCPEQISKLRAAALLHDITKEQPLEKQLQLCEKFDIILEPTAALAHKTLHARTAAALIPVVYPAFADKTVISAVRWHTTGREDMTITDKLVYLADYIDDSRKFPDCVRLRDYFWSAEPQNMDINARLAHLRDTLILSFDMTVRNLLGEGVPISLDTIDARNALLLESKDD